MSLRIKNITSLVDMVRHEPITFKKDITFDNTATLSSTLSVADTATFAGAIDANSTSDFQGAMNLQAGLAVAGAIDANSTSDFQGAMNLQAGLTVAGACNLATTAQIIAGDGILDGTGTLYKASVTTRGNIIYTDILIDLTGLQSSDAGDIIGKAGVAECHIGQITAAINGTILGGTMTCLEVPNGGETDIDLYYADAETGAENNAISTATNEVQITNNGDHTIGRVTPFLNLIIPPANKYLYLVAGPAGLIEGEYSAGRFLIQMWGYAA